MIEIVTKPAVEPLSPAEAKEWLKTDGDVEDDLISTLITAAREQAEHYTNRKFITTTVAETFGVGEPLELSLATVMVVNSVIVGVDTLTPDDDYTIDVNSVGQTVITLTETPSMAPVVNYDVGYGATANDVPVVIKLAMQLIVASFHTNRSDTVRRLPTASEYLLNTVRAWLT